MLRFAIGALIVLFGIESILWPSAPRLWTEFQHGDEFVPATDLKITGYKCTNWNVAMFDHCTVTFKSATTQAAGAITDWRFGRAPTDRIALLVRRDDASAVTTDVSLRTLGNRIAMAAAAAMFGALTLLVLALKMAQTSNTRRRPAPAR